MRVRIGVLALVSIATAACCCRPKIEDRVRNMEAENKRLKFELDATEQANKGSRDYIAELGSPGAEPYMALHFSQAELQQLAQRALPYRIPAKTFNKQLEGTIVVEKLSAFDYKAGNQLTCKMELQGVNIKYKGKVPDMAKGMVRDFIEGVEAGVTADLHVSLTLVGTRVRALAHATNVKMKKNGSDSNEGRLRDEMNARAFKDPLDVDVRIEGYPARIERMILTQNHLVIGYVP